jgi:hypothetical protein
VADRAYVVEKGEIGYSGTAAALAADEEFVRSSYLGDTSTPEPVGTAVAAGPDVRHRDLLTEVNVSLPPALLRGLEERAERDGLDVDEFIRQALEDTQQRKGEGRSR